MNTTEEDNFILEDNLSDNTKEIINYFISMTFKLVISTLILNFSFACFVVTMLWKW